MILLMPILVSAAMLGAGQGDRVASGEWGGRGAILTVRDDGGSVELDCAHGSVEVLSLDKDGRFDVAGRLAREHSGPIRRDETDSSAPARYRGSVEGQTMTLTIVVGDDGSQTLGPFALTLGSAGRLMKCR
jgi:hypothetical protein